MIGMNNGDNLSQERKEGEMPRLPDEFKKGPYRDWTYKKALDAGLNEIKDEQIFIDVGLAWGPGMADDESYTVTTKITGKEIKESFEKFRLLHELEASWREKTKNKVSLIENQFGIADTITLYVETNEFNWSINCRMNGEIEAVRHYDKNNKPGNWAASGGVSEETINKIPEDVMIDIKKFSFDALAKILK